MTPKLWGKAWKTLYFFLGAAGDGVFLDYEKMYRRIIKISPKMI